MSGYQLRNSKFGLSNHNRNIKRTENRKFTNKIRKYYFDTNMFGYNVTNSK